MILDLRLAPIIVADLKLLNMDGCNKAKAISCATAVESWIEHLSVPNRRERKDEEKEIGHQAKEKGKEEKEVSDKQ